MAAILTMPFVDRDRVVIGGQSRGSILSVAYAGQHPEQVKGVINFVGGWSGSRRSFSAFQTAGGTGTFHEFEPPPGTDGHRIVTLPPLWTTAVEAYLKRQGLGGPQ